jgi:hypothetical protein
MSTTAKAAYEFRKRLRDISDQDNVTARQLVGLFYDVYELFMVMQEEMDVHDAESSLSSSIGSLLGGGGSKQPRIMKISPEEFDELTNKRDKKDKDVYEPSKGQYI